MNRIALIVVVATTLAAQEEGGLPVARQLMDLMQWLLNTNFTASERIDFEREVLVSWKGGSSETAQMTKSLAKAKAAVEQMPATERATLKSKMRDMLLDNVRKQPEEPMARVLSAAYSRGQSTDRQNSGGVPFPHELVGRWQSVSTSSVTYQNKATGSYAAPSGNGDIYQFKPNGEYEYYGLIQSSLYNCTMAVNVSDPGVATVNGNTITMRTRGGKMDSKDNCNASFNYVKQLPAKSYVYQWRLEQDQWGLQLCLSAPGTKDTCIRKQQIP